jgi:hypothetical protein
MENSEEPKDPMYVTGFEAAMAAIERALSETEQMDPGEIVQRRQYLHHFSYGVYGDANFQLLEGKVISGLVMLTALELPPVVEVLRWFATIEVNLGVAPAWIIGQCMVMHRRDADSPAREIFAKG